MVVTYTHLHPKDDFPIQKVMQTTTRQIQNKRDKLTTIEPLQGVANRLLCTRRAHSLHGLGKRSRELFGTFIRPRRDQDIGSVPQPDAEATDYQADVTT